MPDKRHSLPSAIMPTEEDYHGRIQPQPWNNNVSLDKIVDTKAQVNPGSDGTTK